MSRRSVTILTLTVAAAALAALLSLLVFSTGANAGGPGYGYGPGMMGGFTSGGYGSSMIGAYRNRAAATTADPTLLIRHQYQHCHSWSLNGGRFRATQSASLKRGATLTVIDDDVMPHHLVKLAGGSVTMRNTTTMPMTGGYLSRTPGLMNHMGAGTTVRFATPGVYRFRTRAGEDYRSGIQTNGADNVLRLTVTVR